MRTTILGISVVILILLGFVIKDTLFKIDIAATKNRLVQNEYLSKVHEIKDSNLLYLEIEKQIKFQENARNEQSADKHLDRFSAKFQHAPSQAEMLFRGKWKKLCCVQGRRTADDYFTITG